MPAPPPLSEPAMVSAIGDAARDRLVLVGRMPPSDVGGEGRAVPGGARHLKSLRRYEPDQVRRVAPERLSARARPDTPLR